MIYWCTLLKVKGGDSFRGILNQLHLLAENNFLDNHLFIFQQDFTKINSR